MIFVSSYLRRHILIYLYINEKVSIPFGLSVCLFSLVFFLSLFSFKLSFEDFPLSGNLFLSFFPIFIIFQPFNLFYSPLSGIFPPLLTRPSFLSLSHSLCFSSSVCISLSFFLFLHLPFSSSVLSLFPSPLDLPSLFCLSLSVDFFVSSFCGCLFLSTSFLFSLPFNVFSFSLFSSVDALSVSQTPLSLSPPALTVSLSLLMLRSNAMSLSLL
ncbi:unnamed protein product [Acanthosepion pharaonis]|uniref:Uncharacterized protein n=1 Tax=Acanthosepion pharaonis TaxID=158019 RepID=A0A812DJ66_ACAPH|nr:unnamed protein product [Sepia pharaonis]